MKESAEEEQVEEEMEYFDPADGQEDIEINLPEQEDQAEGQSEDQQQKEDFEYSEDNF